MSKKQTEKGRFSARKKTDAVLRVLRGEPLDALSRELGVTAATLSEWREMFLAAGASGLKSRTADGRDARIAELQKTLGEMTMRCELQREALRRLKAGLPLDDARWWR